ncbi:hypothetical protein J3D55_003925 [Chryseobacterium ginsenosidimutans]|uniref:hypothetical protein n=1 Tax=Chryseobacterium ginsenosidimutans TaxID=687846 RepID=UPI0021675D72|nr:hypothetical protein [Chryseobacterium ginsenosidimutans]MCS3871009.1 hypothetical protein [Chryseobacterium ginsenosidimutans]
MEKVNIILHPSVTAFFEELITVLYEKNYFGFESDAQAYVRKIYDFIEYNLPIFPYKKTPENLLSLGSKYIFYKANQNTTWYIFFENSENRYLITFITNNYSEIIQFL